MSHLHAEALEVGNRQRWRGMYTTCIQPNMGYVHEDKTGFAELTFYFLFFHWFIHYHLGCWEDWLHYASFFGASDAIN